MSAQLLQLRVDMRKLTNKKNTHVATFRSLICIGASVNNRIIGPAYARDWLTSITNLAIVTKAATN
nr:MAG TPA: hypothetical protein [Caudoviricetes sp.]DAQ18177.1 MAG TPA: hypothetical protein [Caudoviricetes sp.]